MNGGNKAFVKEMVHFVYRTKGSEALGLLKPQLSRTITGGGKKSAITALVLLSHGVITVILA